jgi:AcrR family transcriptional regulator
MSPIRSGEPEGPAAQRTPRAKARPAPRKARRSQSERSAETRARILEAAIDCIAERGFRKATAARIAARAGVSWGAVQHHFGTKESILEAVIARGLEELAGEMRGLRARHPSLEARVVAFTERAWGVFSRSANRAFLQVVLNTSEGASRGGITPHHGDRILAVLEGLWADLFGDSKASAEHQRTAQRLTFSLFSGLALESILMPQHQDFASELHVLQRVLLRLLVTGEGI